MSRLTTRLAQESEELIAAELLVSRMRARVQATCNEISYMEGSRSSVLGNPDLLRACILPFCDADSLVEATRVSRLWNTAATCNFLWEALALARWPCLGVLPKQVVGNFRALYASRAQEGIAAPSNVLDEEQFWILVEMPNVVPMAGDDPEAHLSYAYEHTVVTHDFQHQEIFEESLCSCVAGAEHDDHPSAWFRLPINTMVLIWRYGYDTIP
jgi:hypothetical protein